MNKQIKVICFLELLVVFFFSAWSSNAQSQNGLWQSKNIPDALSGTVSTVIELVPTSDTDNDFDNTAIYISCDGSSDSLRVQIEWDQVLNTDSNVPGNESQIQYRIGDNPIQTEDWSLSNDNETMFYQGVAFNLIQELESSNTFIAQVTPFSSNPISATYNTSGLNSAIGPVLQACEISQQ
jgi:type VI secretion system protein VasI